MPRLVHAPNGDAAAHIKAAAQHLFAKKGVDGVTVREIAEAAGQRNHASVGYYFGSKAELVRELIVDGASVVDNRRKEMLRRLEAAGGPHTVRDVVEVLVLPAFDLPNRWQGCDTYNRFVTILGMSHRDILMDALENRWNSGYLRCLEHLRRLMPDMPAAAKNRRLLVGTSYVSAFVSLREQAFAEGQGRGHRGLREDSAVEDFILTMSALLMA